MKQLRKVLPPRYFHSSKNHAFLEGRPSAAKALHALRTGTIVMLLAMLLTACKSAGTNVAKFESELYQTVYTDDCVVVERAGPVTTVSDKQSGEEYRFTTKRIRKPQTAEEAAQRAIIKTAYTTPTLTIELVRDAIIVREADGKNIYVR